jgi:predicted NBD/HSP70 family sugar kinase
MQGSLRLSYNVRRILAALRAEGPQARADLARLLDLSPPTVTRLTADMLRDGLVVEEPDPARDGLKGYPAKLLSLVPRSIFAAGVYIDPDRIMTCLCDLSGEPLSLEEVPLADTSFQGIMEAASDSVRNQVARAGIDRSRLAGCGVSYPGQYSESPHQVMRIRQFSGWPKINVSRDLEPFFGMPVHHMNDAKAACLAELYYGACRDVQNFCYIWLSYGIGGGAVIDQRPYIGSNGRAAEWGGLFPKSRQRPSGQDLLDRLNAAGLELGRLRDITADHLAHPIATEWCDHAAEQLQWLCLVIARTYSPDAIVFGGTLDDSLIQAFIDRIAASPQLGEDYIFAPPQLLRARLDRLPQLGAAALPLHELLEPVPYPTQARKGW